MERTSRRRLLLWAPVALYMAFIFILSSISRPPDLPAAIGDKAGHALLYFGLGALFVRALAGGLTEPVTAGAAVAAVAYSTLYGVTDELHQMLVPPRAVEFADLVADAVGSGAAAAAAYLAHRLRGFPIFQRKL